EQLDILCFYFFFSSRRRHTRSYGDWSSDVCSSDLQELVAGMAGGELAWFEPHSSPAPDPRFVEQESQPAPHVQQRSGRSMTFDQIGRASCRERVWSAEVGRAVCRSSMGGTES